MLFCLQLIHWRSFTCRENDWTVAMNNKYYPHLMSYMIALHNFGWQSETFIELVIYLLLCLLLCLYLYLFQRLSFNLLNTNPINAIDCVLNTNYINTIENGGFFCLLFLDNLKRSTQMKRQFLFIMVRLKRLLCFIAIKLGKKRKRDSQLNCSINEKKEV